MKKVLITALAAAVFFTAGCKSATLKTDSELPIFGTDAEKTSAGGKKICIPYADVTGYYGYVSSGSLPDEVANGKNIRYLYLWLPFTVPELGVRMASPAVGIPAEKDFVENTWETDAQNSRLYFDPWIRLERAVDIIDLEDIPSRINSTKWLTYGTNDDNPEMPANPAGKKYNSLLRISNDPRNPAKALIRGLYRIGFTCYKTGDVQGSFIVQVGAPVKLAGAVMVKEKTSLLPAIQAAESAE